LIQVNWKTHWVQEKLSSIKEVIVVVDVNNINWITEVHTIGKKLEDLHADEIPSILLGNKSDLASNQRIDETLKQMAEDWGLDESILCSAQKGDNIEEAIQKIVQLLQEGKKARSLKARTKRFTRSSRSKCLIF